MPLRALRLGMAVLLLSACGLIDGKKSETEKGVFPGSVSAGLHQIGAIDPPRAATPSALTLVRTACDQLTGADPDTGKPAPALASKWTFAPGATKLSVTLRTARFQDGSSVTAEAVREALSRVARPSTASPWAPLVSKIAGFPEVQSQAATSLSGIKITGRSALEIQLSQPYSDFPTVMGHPALTPVSLKSLRSDPAGPAAPVCSGPYRISAGDQGRYRLVRSPGASGSRSRGYSQEITVVDFPSDNDAFEAFKTGVVQVAPVPEARVEEAQAHDGYQRSAGLDVTMLAFDVSKPATADPRLRQAISLALDRLLLIDAAYGDKRQPAGGWLGNTGAAESAPACSQHARRIADAPRAKEIFNAIGVDPATVVLPLIFDERTVGRFVPQAISIQAKDALGIQLQPQPMDPEALEESVRARAKPAIWILSVPVSLPIPDEALGSLFHTGSPGNRLGFSSPEIDAVIDRARKAASREEAARLWAGAEDAVCGQMPSIPLWRTVHHWITDPAEVAVEGSGLVDLSGSPVLRNVHRR